MTTPDTLPARTWLLCFNRDRGRLAGSTGRAELFGAAALADLWLDGRITLDDRVAVAGGSRPPADPLLAELWTRIRDEKPRRLSAWLRRAGIEDAVRGQLVAAGTIRVEREPRWFRSGRYALRDTRTHTRLAQRLASTARNPLPPDRQDPRDTMLVALLATAEIHLTLTKPLRREHKNRIDAMKATGGPIVKTLRSAMQSAHAAAV
jgi:hypothetical protein